MSNKLRKIIEEWVNGIYDNSEHLIRTGYWIKRLDPNATDAMYIAAVTHDVERAFKEGRNPPSAELSGAVWDDPVYNLWHGDRSAMFVSGFLKNEGVDERLIDEIYKLVKHHEDGGWKEADILKDADSVSFLEVNASMFISKIGKDLNQHKGLTKEEVRSKFEYMYNRISGKNAKKLAKPFYDKALADLGKIK
jgi:hypothetical protein